jgi:hypothetical protein
LAGANCSDFGQERTTDEVAEGKSVGASIVGQMVRTAHPTLRLQRRGERARRRPVGDGGRGK